MNNQLPPERISRFLKWFCPPNILETVEGDLIERYQDDLDRYSKRKADFLFIKNVIFFIRPGILRKRQFNQYRFNKSMWYSNLKVAIRNFKSDTTGSLINLFGLTVGICSSIIILSIVDFENSFDTFHTDAEHIYRVVRVSQIEGETEYRNGVVYPLAEAIKRDLPQVVNQTSILHLSWEAIQVSIKENGKEDRFVERSGYAFTQPSFFDLFDFKDTEFKWIAGDPTSSMNNPFSIVLTETLARKYFDEEVPIGKIIHLDEIADFEVTGIITDLPANSDFNLKAFISYSTLIQYIGESANSWSSVGDNQLYVKINPGVTPEEMNVLLDTLHSAYAPKSISDTRKYKLQALSDIHSNPNFGNFNNRVVSNEKIAALSFVGLFLLITACINFINLATARGSLRAREVGVRKVLGSSRKQLTIQFLMEAFLITLTAVIIALIGAETIIPGFQSLLGTPREGLLVANPFILSSVGLILVFVTFAAGFYPAIFLSSLTPIKAIKSKTVSSESSLKIRQYLVIAQFTLTMLFLTGTVVVMMQVQFFKSYDLGFKKDAIINLELPVSNYGDLNILKSKLKNLPSISEVSFSSTLPSGEQRNSSFWDVKRKDSENTLITEVQHVDASYFPLYEIDIISGRNFRRKDTIESIIINNTLAKKLGFGNNDDALNQEIKLGSRNYQIIGVIADFHSKSLKEEIDKIVFIQKDDSYNIASIKISFDDPEQLKSNLFDLVNNLENAWNLVFPDNVYNYRFFDENIEAFYKEENRFSQLLLIFTSILIFIGCLGLYGLILFVVDRKLKEVAIRKIFGAGIISIIGFVNKDFWKMILVSFFLAAPISYYLMQIWLSNFAYHIEISWWVLLLPLLIVCTLAILVTSGQSIKAAITNPAEILSNE